MDNFSTRFKELKALKKCTYAELAEVLNLTPRTIKFYASGDVKPDYKGLIFLADYFDVSLDYLVGRSDVKERR